MMRSKKYWWKKGCQYKRLQLPLCPVMVAALTLKDKRVTTWSIIKVCPHYETGLMRVEAKPDLSGLNLVSTRPHSIRVDASSVNLNSLGYFKTAKANNNTSACCQIIGILSATALEKRSWCMRTKRTILDPVSTHFEPTYVCGLAEPGFNPVSPKVGWVRTRNIRVQSRLNPGSRASADMPLETQEDTLPWQHCVYKIGLGLPFSETAFQTCSKTLTTIPVKLHCHFLN